MSDKKKSDETRDADAPEQEAFECFECGTIIVNSVCPYCEREREHPMNNDLLSPEEIEAIKEQDERILKSPMADDWHEARSARSRLLRHIEALTRQPALEWRKGLPLVEGYYWQRPSGSDGSRRSIMYIMDDAANKFEYKSYLYDEFLGPLSPENVSRPSPVEADVEAFWLALERSWDIEPREYFEREAPKNGFGSPLAMAVHYMWKRETKPAPVEAMLEKVREMESDYKERHKGTSPGFGSHLTTAGKQTAAKEIRVALEAIAGAPADAPACKCGLVMSKNPHANAGDPLEFVDVGATYECIPCLTKNRHEWATRAQLAELARAQLELERGIDAPPAVSGDVASVGKRKPPCPVTAEMDAKLELRDAYKRGMLRAAGIADTHAAKCQLKYSSDSGAGQDFILAMEGRQRSSMAIAQEIRREAEATDPKESDNGKC